MLARELKRLVEQDKPDLIGLGGLCIDYEFIRDSIRIIRSLNPGLPVLLGGRILTHDRDFIFEQLNPDYGIIGDGEEVIVQLLESLEKGAPALDGIPNLCFRRDGAARFTETRFEYPPLETRAHPDYEPFDAETMIANTPHLTRWNYRYPKPFPRAMPFVAARGCPFSCTFCIHKNGPRYAARPMADILDEISRLHERYAFNLLILIDELFAVDKNRLREFCEGIMEGRKTKGWDFAWLFQTHANARLGREELRLAKEAGCFFFSYGFESASPRVLESMNKKSKPEQISEAIRLSTEVGLCFGGNLIFGDVAETHETICETMNFWFQHMDARSFIPMVTVAPSPGSALFDHCVNAGIIKDRVAFYENIKYAAVMYNMTSIPDRAWWEWVTNLGILRQDLHFLMVEPFEVQRDPTPAPGLIPKPLWLVVARCPHCQAVRLHREAMAQDEVDGGAAFFLTGCLDCGKLFKVHMKPAGRYKGDLVPQAITKDHLRGFVQDAIFKLGGINNWQACLLRT